MASAPSPPVADWLEELDRLIARDEGVPFHDHLISVAARRLSASGGALWRESEEDRLEVVAQLGLGDEPIDRMHESWSGHEQILRQVMESGRPQTVSGRLDQSVGNAAQNGPASTPLNLIVAPVLNDDDKPEGVVELFVAGPHNGSIPASSAESLHEFCRLALTNRPNPGTPRQALPAETLAFADLTRQIHDSLDVETVAAAAVKQTKFWTDCSRVSLFVRRGRRCRLLAVSDQGEIDRRSRTLRSLERSADVVAQGRRPIWSDEVGSAEADVRLPEELAAADWLIAAVPLIDHNGTEERVIGVLWAEDFGHSATWTDARRTKLTLCAEQATGALSNSLEHRNRSILGWRRVLSVIPKWLAIAVFLGGLAAGLTFVQTDFDVTGRGMLRPRIQRNVYARVDGVVQQPTVEHGDPVEAGAPLLRLRNPDLEKERAELEGRIRTTEQQIADLEVLRASPDRGEERGPRDPIELAARQAELAAVLQNLQGQEAALSRYEQELDLSSPVSGVVLTWDVEQLLKGRWVHAGQRLLTVADLDGPWIVEILVPDRDLDHVLAAGDEDDPAKVTFVTATDLETQHSGVVVDVAHAVRHDPIAGPVVVVTVDVDDPAALERQPGSSVYPRIHCGRQSLGYVWFRRFYESVVSWLAL